MSRPSERRCTQTSRGPQGRETLSESAVSEEALSEEVLREGAARRLSAGLLREYPFQNFSDRLYGSF